MPSVQDMILQWGSTIKVSTELPDATRHRRDMTETLLKATLNPNWEVADDITHQELSSLLETPKQIFNKILMYFEHKYFSYR